MRNHLDVVHYILKAFISLIVAGLAAVVISILL